MKQHANAALTIAKRKQVKSLFENQQVSIAELAHRFQVHRDTVRKWIRRDSPFDKPSGARKKRVVTPEYESAVIEYRRQNPQHGAIRLAQAVQARFPFANRGTVAIILKRSGLTKTTQPPPKTKWRIPVGRHRLQCDIQELPAIKGSKGFEYKISFIHLRTRWKYSEIHLDCQTETVAAVYQRALDSLPPFS
jgi:transposase-like protein